MLKPLTLGNWCSFNKLKKLFFYKCAGIISLHTIWMAVGKECPILPCASVVSPQVLYAVQGTTTYEGHKSTRVPEGGQQRY